MEPKEKTSRKFAVLPAKAVNDIAENIYGGELLPDISRLLAEDVSYRLRSLIQVCYVQHKKTCLCIDRQFSNYVTQMSFYLLKLFVFCRMQDTL